jgi:hypothetical protein
MKFLDLFARALLDARSAAPSLDRVRGRVVAIVMEALDFVGQELLSSIS